MGEMGVSGNEEITLTPVTVFFMLEVMPERAASPSLRSLGIGGGGCGGGGLGGRVFAWRGGVLDEGGGLG